MDQDATIVDHAPKQKKVMARRITVSIRYVIYLIIVIVGFMWTVADWKAGVEATIIGVEDKLNHSHQDIFELKNVPLNMAVIKTNLEAICQRLDRVEHKVDYIASKNGYRKTKDSATK
jgi:hypothetical protein